MACSAPSFSFISFDETAIWTLPLTSLYTLVKESPVTPLEEVKTWPVKVFL